MKRSTDVSVVALKLAGAVLALLPLAFITRSFPTLFFKPLTEDGFYSLSVARNLAMGNGLTIDGSHLTNGFQPAVTMLDSVAFLDHGNRVVGVRIVLIVSWLIMVATCGVVALICRDLATNERARQVAPWVAVIGFLSGRYVLYAFNGLETGGEILVCALVWRFYQTRGVTSRLSAVLMGVLLGLLILVRIDGIFLMAIVAASVVWELRSREGVLRGILIAVTAGVVSAPWWLYNQITFGHLLPTSGKAEQSIHLTFSRLPSLLIGAMQDFVPWGYTAKTQTLWFSMIELVAVAAAIAAITRRPKLIDDEIGDHRARVERGNKFAVLLTLAIVVLGAFYFVETDAVWFYGRYLAPAILVGSVSGVAYCLNRGFSTPKILTTVAAAALLVGVVFTFHFDRGATSTYYSNQLSLINKYVPPEDLVGAGQSGTIGFMRANVVNLDGKVNQSALEHQDNIRLYLLSRHIEWLCDQSDYVTRYLSDDPTKFGWTEVAQQNGFELWRWSRAETP